MKKKRIILRNPNFSRPWQFVLEPLKGYLILAQKQFYNPIKFSGAWNFGTESKFNIKVIDIVKNESATGIKNVTVNEPYFEGHFPSSPVLPGVLQIESMAQTAAVLVAKSLDISDSSALVLLTTIDNAKFRRPVTPGDVMSLSITVQKMRNKIWKFEGEVIVNSQKMSECEFSAMMRI